MYQFYKEEHSMSTRTYQSYFWYNQIIQGELVNSVRVRIFKALNKVASNNYEKVIATDGETISKRRYQYTSHYSYVVLSSDIDKTLQLRVKVYLTDEFDLSLLENKDFLGKNYVVEAIKKYLTVGRLSPMLNHFYEKIGDNYRIFYNLLKNTASAYHIATVEQLFRDYQISNKYQALFWKEMYLGTNQIEKIQKSYKLRWKNLLNKHFPYATVNVKMYLKKEAFFIHKRDLVSTDGQVHNSFVYNFSYVLVRKSIKRQETPGTWHLDIKIYVRDFFDPKYLPKITAFWGEYVHEVLKYLPNLKK